MITIDCPFCSGDAHIDAALDTVSCDGCGVTVDVTADVPVALEAAA